ncbi:hypothetical protein [Bradyrhizobium sp.]|nr:hypothetical protein [Bradyrhizobium sp.]
MPLRISAGMVAGRGGKTGVMPAARACAAGAQVIDRIAGIAAKNRPVRM